MDEPERVVCLLAEWQAGDPSAYDRLIPLVYNELRRLARAQLRREAPGHSCQPTLLVHEAYLRLADAGIEWQSRAHFLSVAARVMRRIMVERARAKRAGKRGGDAVRVTLTSSVPARLSDPVDVLRLDSALQRLQALDARQAQVVELCYFGGLTQVEIGRTLAISPATVERDLRHARAWLRRELASTETVR